MDESIIAELRTLLEDVRRQVTLLAGRISSLEQSREAVDTRSGALRAGPPAAGALNANPGGVPVEATAVRPPPVAIGSADTLSEELQIVISAAVAAFLGERAHIHQIRLISSSFWAHQGRASVQASHRLNR